MTIAFVNSTVAQGGSSPTTITHAAISAGRLLAMFLVSKANSRTPTAPSGWTDRGFATGGSGSTGNDTGSVRLTLFTAEATGSETDPLSVTWSSSGAFAKAMLAFSRTSTAWAAPAFAFGSDVATSTGTEAVDVAADTDPGYVAGDLVVVGYATPTDAGVYSNPQITIPGCTVGPVDQRAIMQTTEGNDGSIVVFTAAVTAGTSTGAPRLRVDVTDVNASAGPACFVRLRESGTTVTPPTVSAGDPLTIETGGPAFTRTGTATPNGAGVTIVSQTWERRPESTVNPTLTGTATATVEVTPPASPGTLVLRKTAVDSNGQSASSDVTFTFVQPGQVLRPVSDVNNSGGWTVTPSGSAGLYTAVDEVLASTADYISSPSNADGASCTLGLGPGVDPGVHTGHILEFVAWRDPTTSSHLVTMQVLEGSTVIAERDYDDFPAGQANAEVRQLELTELEAAEISPAGYAGGLRWRAIADTTSA